MRSRTAIIVSIALMLVTVSAMAQNTDIESVAGLEFNFGNPGARSLAMGGAFLGLADDASAAEANPAGLTILRRPEISLEGRNFETIAIMNTSGIYPDLIPEEFNTFSRSAEVNFASVVFPVGNGALAAYYHLPLSYENTINAAWQFNIFNQATPRSLPIFYLPKGDPVGSEGPVSYDQCIAIINETGDPFACLQYQLFPFFSTVSIKLQTYGLAGAWRFGNLSLGVGVRRQEFQEFAQTSRTDTGVSTITSQVTQATVDSQGNIKKQSDTTYTVGFKYVMSDRWSLGGVYKKGPEFDTSLYYNDLLGGTGLTNLGTAKFHVPDTWGVGISYRPIPVLTINVDSVKVNYSNLTDNFQSIYPEIQVLDQPYKSKDVTELHVGAEYFFATTIPVAIRAGWWRDPAHAIQYNGPLTCTDSAIAESDRQLCAANRNVLNILFPGSKDQDHKSIGIGLAWPRFQIDAAYETSDRYKVGSLSGVFRF